MFAATGGGEYWGEFSKMLLITKNINTLFVFLNTSSIIFFLFIEDIEGAIYINATEVERNSQKFLHLNRLEVDFNFGTVQMGIKKTNKKNKILGTTILLFQNLNCVFELNRLFYVSFLGAPW